jgi:hypothetical protein
MRQAAIEQAPACRDDGVLRKRLEQHETAGEAWMDRLPDFRPIVVTRIPAL